MEAIKISLLDRLLKRGVTPSKTLSSIILVGGLGKRLNPKRKLITKDNFPHLNKQFYNQYGAKGMAILNLEEGKQTITDKHLQAHYRVKEICDVTLALGCQPNIFLDYYKNSSLKFLIEQNPAGTIAPLVKLWCSGKLGFEPLVYANGDNLIEIDFYEAYLKGILAAQKANIDLNYLVINILTQVPYKYSINYGTVDFNKDSQIISGFYEKKPLQKGRDLNKPIPINSGFSIICNPYALVEKYLDKKVINVSQALERQDLNYAEYENIVKYEIFYEKLASQGLMVGVLTNSYWTDLGTEEKLIEAEAYFNK